MDGSKPVADILDGDLGNSLGNASGGGMSDAFHLVRDDCPLAFLLLWKKAYFADDLSVKGWDDVFIAAGYSPIVCSRCIILFEEENAGIAFVHC